jgi:hypothetical protein
VGKGQFNPGTQRNLEVNWRRERGFQLNEPVLLFGCDPRGIRQLEASIHARGCRVGRKLKAMPFITDRLAESDNNARTIFKFFFRVTGEFSS